MRNSLLLGVASVFTLLSAAAAQQSRPNFSGHWTAVSETGGTAGAAPVVAVGARSDGGRAFFFLNQKEADPRFAAGQPFFFFNGPGDPSREPRQLQGGDITLTQDASTLTVEYAGPEPRTKLSYRLDGTESRNAPPPIGDSEVVSTAAWDGSKLVITHTQKATIQQQAVTITSTQTISIAMDGTLTVETKRGNTTSRTTYKKN